VSDNESARGGLKCDSKFVHGDISLIVAFSMYMLEINPYLLEKIRKFTLRQEYSIGTVS